MQAFRRFTHFGLSFLLVLGIAGCTGGAAGDPSDDIGDIIVIGTSPGNGVELNVVDSSDGFNALNNLTLQFPGSIAVRFANTILRSSVLTTDPTDPQGTTPNVRFFYFDETQGPFDEAQPVVPGVNPPGAKNIDPPTPIQFDTVDIGPR